MSRASNATCAVCHSSPAKWLCRCANEGICPEGPCLATHMAKSGRSHVLVEYELGSQLPAQEAECYMKSVDAGAEVVEFVRTEGEWLTQERDRLAREVDQGIESYADQLRSYGLQKKQELDRMLEKSVTALDIYKTPAKREQGLQTKQKGKHLITLNCMIRELQTDKLIELQANDLTELQQNAIRYQMANSVQHQWNFGGKFDAISFQASKGIRLTGISLCKGETERGLVLHSLAILKGKTTTSKELYRDTEKRYMDSAHPFQVDVQLQSSVLLAPNTDYTIKVLLMGCRGKGSGALRCSEQGGLVIIPFNTVFNGAEISNCSSALHGVFYELHYLP